MPVTPSEGHLLDALLDALRVAILAVDTEGVIAFANNQAVETFAGSGSELIGRDVFELVSVADDVAAARGALAELVGGGLWQGDLVLIRADGTTMTAGITASPLLREDGAVTGAIAILEDVTAIRLTQAEAAAAEQRLRLAHVAAQLGSWHWDAVAGTNVWDAQLQAIFGLSPGVFDGTFEAWSALLHPDDREEVFATVQRAMAAGSSYICKHRLVRPDGTVRWFEGVGQVTLGEHGESTGTIGCGQDVTERVEAERANEAALVQQLEAAVRADVLQQVTADFARAATVEEVGDVLRNRLQQSIGATNAGVFVADRPTGALRLVTSFGYGDVREELDSWPSRGPAAGVDPDIGTDTVLTGDALTAQYPTLREVNRLLGDPFTVAVPMEPAAPAEGVVLFGFEHQPDLGDADVVLLGTLAGQCGIAVERTILLRRTREIAEQLQSSLAASPLPQSPVIELAAHYAPGGDELEHVGGDWYDAVETTGDGMALVVGDVMGRGVQAATSMIRIRGGIRGLLTVDPTPDVVLEAADRLLNRDAPEQFVTAMCVLVDPTAGLLFLSNAGHIPAVVVSPDGTAHVVTTGGGVPLGVDHEDPREVAVLPVERGTTVVLVTDGVVESRDRDLDEGIARLAERAAALHGVPLAELVAELAALAGEDPDDDVTVVAARLT